eukprot:TRINITY_DN74060_c0_g1_i1.p1 TRINITY_DN74060_c0_g1~~TRINITY_DN74060_c0_g1_i1.p1  ORF type:complete len:304 (-),score=39.96 TRINITY_DN74060_c0_g1_i1:224-1135(-)
MARCSSARADGATITARVFVLLRPLWFLLLRATPLCGTPTPLDDYLLALEDERHRLSLIEAFDALREWLFNGTCSPWGYAQRYGILPESAYPLHEDFGSVYGYDSSDPRYRFPHDYDPRYAGLPPGGYLTPVYNLTDNQTGDLIATLYLTGEHVALQDMQYQECTNISAVVNLAARELFHEDKYPYWGPWPSYADRPVFKAYGQVFRSLPQISLPWQRWHRWFPQVSAWIDDHLSQGHNIMMFDEEGSKGAAATAIGYMMTRGGMLYDEAYEKIYSMRRWIDDLNETNYRELLIDDPRLEPTR